MILDPEILVAFGEKVGVHLVADAVKTAFARLKERSTNSGQPATDQELLESLKEAHEEAFSDPAQAAEFEERIKVLGNHLRLSARDGGHQSISNASMLAVEIEIGTSAKGTFNIDNSDLEGHAGQFIKMPKGGSFRAAGNTHLHMDEHGNISLDVGGQGSSASLG